MKPAYRLSRESEAGNISPATKVKQVEAWLAGLSGQETGVKAELLAEYLVAHDRADVSPSLRRQIADMLRGSIDAVADELFRSLKEATLPMQADAGGDKDRLLSLLRARADFGKRLIRDHLDQAPRLFGGNPVPEFVAELLRTSTRMLDVSYETHSEVPSGVWHDLHQTAAYVYRDGFAEENLPAEFKTFHAGYLAALLEAVADPYHASNQERIWIRDVIARVGGLARIEDGLEAGHKGVFGVGFRKDASPRPLSWLYESGERFDLVLNTTPLARKLASCINQKLQGGTPEEALPSIRHPDYLALLKRLKLLWGGSMRRLSTRRLLPKLIPCQVWFGFYPVHDLLGKPPGKAAEAKACECMLVNESVGGAALKLLEASLPLQIGALIYVAQDEIFRGVGLVRWFRQDKDGVTTVGLRFLVGQPKLVTLTAANGLHLYPALLMEHDLAKEGGTLNLVLPSVRIDTTGMLEMRHDGERFSVKLEEKLNGSNDANLYRCRIVEAIPRATGA